MGEDDNAMQYDQDMIFRHLYVHDPSTLHVLVLNRSMRCFYIDSPSNARANGMQIKQNLKNEDAIAKEWACLISGECWRGLLIDTTRRLDKVEALISSNGGRVAGLDEPRLTHIVVDRRDASRRLELMKRTSMYVVETQPFWDVHLIFVCAVRPKRRHLVISEFITACLEESTLLDEEGESAENSQLELDPRLTDFRRICAVIPG